MQCVMLAAGEGQRMRPLTNNKPKPMLEILGKPILEHIFDLLPQEIDEVILVVGYLGSQIKDYFGEQFQGKKIKYIWQKEKSGTWKALELCKDYLLDNEKFLMLYGDDLHSKESIRQCLKWDLSLLAHKAENPERFGVVVHDGEGKVINIVEKPANPPSNIVSTGVLVLDKRIFNYKVSRHPVAGEYFLTDALAQMLKDHDIFVEHTDFWLPIGYPEDLKKAENILKTKVL